MNMRLGDISTAANRLTGVVRRPLALLRLPPPDAARHKLCRAYLLPVLAVAATLALRIALDAPLRGRPTVVVFLLPIILSAYLGGWQPGLLATALACLGTNYYLLPPLHSFAVMSESERWKLGSLALAGLLISVSNEALHRAHRRANMATRQQKQAAAALRDSETHLRTVLETQPECVKIVSREGLLLEMNPAGLVLTGAGSLEEAQQKPLVEYVTPEHRAAFLDLHRHVMAGGTGVLEFAAVSLRGRSCWLETHAAPLRAADGTVQSVLAITRDITARKQSEAAANRLAAIVESSQDAIIGKSLGGIIESWNPGAEKIYGYPAAEMIGQPITRIVPPELHQEAAAHLEKVGRGERIPPVETRRLRRDRGLLDVSLTISPIKDAAGRIVGASHVAHDITLEKRTELALRASEVRHRRLFETSRNGILFLDAITGMVIDVNPFLTALSGFSHAQFLEKPVWELGFFGAALASESQFAVIREKEQVLYENLSLETREGARIEVELLINVYLVNRAKVIHCIVRDVTAHRQAEAAVQQLHQDLEQRVADRTAELAAANHALQTFSAAVARDLCVAEAADRIKSAFLATMSHELRTPLNSILGFTGIVLGGLAGPLNAEQTKQLGMVRGSARHLLELINDVLDLSKIEAGQLTVHCETFNLRAALERVTASIRPLADKKGLALSIDVSPVPAEFYSDRRRVEQILLNLLSNAVKFTEHGGVTLTTRSVADFQPWPDAVPCAALCIEVSDTGVGIRSDDLATLFQPFRQIDSGLARRSEGTGLGLAISRRLASLLDGQITAVSEWSKGSTFTFSLPLQPAAGPCLPPSS